MYADYIDRLEIAQKCIKFLCYKFNIVYRNIHNYDNLLLYFGLLSLHTRRQCFDMCLLFKILNNMTDCKQILNMFSIHVARFSVSDPSLLQYHFIAQTTVP